MKRNESQRRTVKEKSRNRGGGPLWKLSTRKPRPTPPNFPSLHTYLRVATITCGPRGAAGLIVAWFLCLLSSSKEESKSPAASAIKRTQMNDRWLVSYSDSANSFKRFRISAALLPEWRTGGELCQKQSISLQVFYSQIPNRWEWRTCLPAGRFENKLNNYLNNQILDDKLCLRFSC